MLLQAALTLIPQPFDLPLLAAPTAVTRLLTACTRRPLRVRVCSRVPCQADAPQLHCNLRYISRFRHPSKLVSEAAYYLTHAQSALSFVASLTPSQVPAAAVRGAPTAHAPRAAARRLAPSRAAAHHNVPHRIVAYRTASSRAPSCPLSRCSFGAAAQPRGCLSDGRGCRARGDS